MSRRLHAWIAFSALVFCSLAATAPTPAQDEDTNAVTPTGVAPHRHTSQRKHRATTKPSESPEPALVPTVPSTVPPTSASSVIVVNAHSGEVLYEKNPDQLRPPASTEKLLTALVVAESGDLERIVTVETIDTMAEPVKLNIRPGDHYRRIDLLRALLVKSPNDVARCLARDNAGSIVGFAERMNQRARELGATNSHFINPNGLPVPGQYSTARDLALIARAAYANPIIRSIVCLPQLTFTFANGRTRELENTNRLLRQLPYCNGMKTGYTEAAGKCLIASGTRPGKDVIVVVLGDTSGRVWRDAGALLAWGLWNSAG
jgi:D-alanyl-D-alanine carboxypeptidase (penicillin-binding protein 5/6)